MTTAASAGMMPTIDRTLTATACAGRGDQPVVEQPVLLVPQALLVQCGPDAGEVLEELQHQILRVAVPDHVKDRGDRAHRDRERTHPAGRVRLLQHVPVGQMRTVDRPDVVQAEEAAGEDVIAVQRLAG